MSEKVLTRRMRNLLALTPDGQQVIQEYDKAQRPIVDAYNSSSPFETPETITDKPVKKRSFRSPVRDFGD